MKGTGLKRTLGRVAAAGMASASLAALTVPAMAQEVESGGVQEIIVTAQKRAQSAQAVGISITALGADTLRQMGVRDSTDIVAQVPNLQNASVFGPGTNVNLAIRGVALNDYNDGTEAPVAVYFDEIYMVPLGAGSFPAYDLNRVEVLRGPQGTLFGRNTTGGIIHYVTNKPELGKTSGGVELGYGSYDTREANGYVNLAAGSDFAVRAAGYYHKNDGWMKNSLGQPDSGVIDSHAARIQARYKSGGLDANFKFEYAHAQGPATSYHGLPASRDPVTGVVQLDGPDNSPWKVGENGDPNFLAGASSYNGGAYISYDFGDVTLNSVTGYNHYSRLSIEDCDGTAARTCQNSYDFTSRQYSQELRLSGKTSSLDWTLGAYYLDQKGDGHNTAPLFIQANGVPTLIVDAQYSQRLKSAALFANLDYHLSDQFSVIVGARFTKDKKSFSELLRYFATDTSFDDVWPKNPHDFNEIASIARVDFSPGTVGDLARINQGSLAAKVELNWKPEPGKMVYASVSRGIKGGGFNNGYFDLGTPASDIPYKGETVYAYEAGTKLDLLDRKLRVNGAVFYYDYKNYQTLTFINLGSAIRNRDAILYGAELELTAQPTDQLFLSLGGGLLDTKVKDVPSPTNFVADREMLLAPKWSLNGMARYEFPVGPGSLSVQSDFKASAKYHADIINSPALDIPSYVVVNGRIEYTAPDERYRVALFVKNMFDNKYRIQAFDLTGNFNVIYQQFAPPRWFGISVSAKFGER